MELLEEHRCFEGRQQRWRHDSTTLNCAMTFSIFLPPADNPPVLFWLSGLTCNDENFTTKAGAQRIAAELGIALVMPDTSPRGDDVADDAGYDLGKGAGFYLNATEQPWASHYRMYDYIRDELPALVHSQFAVSERCATQSLKSWSESAPTQSLMRCKGIFLSMPFCGRRQASGRCRPPCPLSTPQR